jgi:hypothetical protein
MGDVEQAAALIASFIRALETDTSFIPNRSA